MENQTSVRYTPTDMKLNASEVFYYESDVSYYDGDTLKNTSMYSSVTVVPATIIYYEDSTQFVSFSGNWTGTASSTAKQDTDRPGVDAVDISALYDANNVYGYDSAYENCATYSLGSASKATVSKGSPATATFTFTGTGFDVISLTSGDTGTITVDVYAGSSATGTPARSWIVDTYYGYQYSVDTENPWIKYTWKLGTDGKWHVYSSEETKEKGESTYDSSRAYAAGDTFVSYVANEVWTAADKGALYQVPVIKSPGSTGNAEGEIPNQKDLGYDTWTVVITALYGSGFDHKSDGSYDFYLDAIRIYNPAGAGASVTDGTVLDAYIKDKEYAPTFIEIRDQLLAANSLTAGTTATGIVFIDSLAATSNTTDTSSIS